jgi:hypothetical protein
MSINLKEWHLSKNVLVFQRASQLIQSPEKSDIEEIGAVIKELENYEAQIRALRQEVFQACTKKFTSTMLKET